MYFGRIGIVFVISAFQVIFGSETDDVGQMGWYYLELSIKINLAFKWNSRLLSLERRHIKGIPTKVILLINGQNIGQLNLKIKGGYTNYMFRDPIEIKTISKYQQKTDFRAQIILCYNSLKVDFTEIIMLKSLDMGVETTKNISYEGVSGRISIRLDVSAEHMLKFVLNGYFRDGDNLSKIYLSLWGEEACETNHLKCENGWCREIKKYNFTYCYCKSYWGGARCEKKMCQESWETILRDSGIVLDGSKMLNALNNYTQINIEDSDLSIDGTFECQNRKVGHLEREMVSLRLETKHSGVQSVYLQLCINKKFFCHKTVKLYSGYAYIWIIIPIDEGNLSFVDERTEFQVRFIFRYQSLMTDFTETVVSDDLYGNIVVQQRIKREGFRGIIYIKANKRMLIQQLLKYRMQLYGYKEGEPLSKIYNDSQEEACTASNITCVHGWCMQNTVQNYSYCLCELYWNGDNCTIKMCEESWSQILVYSSLFVSGGRIWTNVETPIHPLKIPDHDLKAWRQERIRARYGSYSPCDESEVYDRLFGHES
ncbi:hypothetical protein RF11_05956 [Thelohanellus kitauei]|uniref:EGF-like domain-containing protein n=1 Tax=Thelohanellus kitauei TaxID=669202 RepID=A0A0C2MKQ9_THEKT|nr:hypothetical protein RF11_05956 [Thelohanellus kitauei]